MEKRLLYKWWGEVREDMDERNLHLLKLSGGKFIS